MATKKIGHENWEARFYLKNIYGEVKENRKRGFRTKKDAENYIKETIEKNSNINNISCKTMLNDFLEYKKSSLRPRTLKHYNFFTNKTIEKIGHIDLEKINIKIILEFLKIYNDRPVQQNKLRKYLKMAFNYAITFHGLKLNPVNSIRLNNKLKKKKEKEIWTYDEFIEFINIMKNEKFRSENYKNRAILYFKLLYFTGARPGEIAALTKKDFNYREKMISINKTRLNEETSDLPKNDSSIRTISIPTNISNELKEHCLNLYGDEKEYLFANTKTYQMILVKIRKKYNLKYISLHGFRHSHASLLIKKGVPITDISKRLGHATPNITLGVYSHFYKEDKDNVIDLLNNL